MLETPETSYSREDTIAAIRNFYTFLTKMYLPNSMLEEPPAGGWPRITDENVRLLGKNQEVAELMRHLPYVSDQTLLAPRSEIMFWPDVFASHPNDRNKPWDGTDTDDILILSDGLEHEHVTPAAFGLLVGKDTIILDTQFGVVHWWDQAPGEARDHPIRERISEDFFWDCTPESEHGWRHCPTWGIADFFEVLKSLYRDLKFVPIHSYRVEEWFSEYETDDYAPYLSCIRNIYKEHGWPDLSVYKKKECMEAVAKLLEERFPDEDY